MNARVDVELGIDVAQVSLDRTNGDVELWPISSLRPPLTAKLKRVDLNRFTDFGGFGSDSPDRAKLIAKAVERGIEASGSRAAWTRETVEHDFPV